MKYQKGFAPLIIILLVVLGIGVVGGGYVIYKDKQQQKEFEAKIQDLKNSPTSDKNNDQISYVGVHYPPYPNGVKFFSSAGYGQDKFFDTHMVQEMFTPTGPELWIGRIESRDSKGIPNVVVTDAMKIPVPDFNGSKFIAFIGLCGLLASDNSIVHDDTIVALTDRFQESKEGHMPAIKAWKINTTTEKFETYSPVGIICDSEAGPGYS